MLSTQDLNLDLTLFSSDSYLVLFCENGFSFLLAQNPSLATRRVVSWRRDLWRVVLCLLLAKTDLIIFHWLLEISFVLWFSSFDLMCMSCF
ncbi:hypothetical protein OIU84_009802 [Salix udensis]|uniref:Uncharacterized protein n=1 Tax=Salix udensis TaxID=889485 RepID=A0AAD6NV45_9ROSI|nr:hypothetical protein OIU84_009802 [Salix udensis]